MKRYTKHHTIINYLLLPILLSSTLIISSCSFNTPSSDWQIKSKNAFTSYTKNYLSSKDLLAKSDLNRAIKHANVSADLYKLARLYLATCALEISVGIDTLCANYLDIKGIVKRKDLNAYYQFIQDSIRLDDIKKLPLKYQLFAQQKSNGNYSLATKMLFDMTNPTSTFLAASLIKEELSPLDRQRLIKLASNYGYKKLVIFWLKERIRHTPNLDEKMIYQQKIRILESTD